MEIEEILALVYYQNTKAAVAVADVCDEILDKSGAMLGRVRELAYPDPPTKSEKKMQDQILLNVTIVVDDDTGIYSIGELDFGIFGTCYQYIENPENRENLAAWLQMLADRCRNSQSPFGKSPTDGQTESLVQQVAAAALPSAEGNQE